MQVAFTRSHFLQSSLLLQRVRFFGAEQSLVPLVSQITAGSNPSHWTEIERKRDVT